MKRVNVLTRIDGFDDRGVVNLLWQRQLHEDAIHVVVSVQRGHH
jgi:hypothetical protein